MTPHIFQTRRLECPVVDYDWPFARVQADVIARHFEKQKALRPKMFDGQVLLCRKPHFSDGFYHAEYFLTRFSAFLAWRDFGFPDADVFNGFGMAALQGADGPFLLGEMAQHTANAGQSYFPAGTPDPSDVFEGRVDLASSTERELAEETGLARDAVDFADDWTIVVLGPRIACFRKVVARKSALETQADIERFLLGEREPELARIHRIARPSDLQELVTPDFLRAFFDMRFRVA